MKHAVYILVSSLFLVIAGCSGAGNRASDASNSAVERLNESLSTSLFVGDRLSASDSLSYCAASLGVSMQVDPSVAMLDKARIDFVGEIVAREFLDLICNQIDCSWRCESVAPGKCAIVVKRKSAL